MPCFTEIKLRWPTGECYSGSNQFLHCSRCAQFLQLSPTQYCGCHLPLLCHWQGYTNYYKARSPWRFWTGTLSRSQSKGKRRPILKEAQAEFSQILPRRYLCMEFFFIFESFSNTLVFHNFEHGVKYLLTCSAKDVQNMGKIWARAERQQHFWKLDITWYLL